MKRLPRLLPCVALACSLSLPLLYAPPAGAQAAPPPAANPPGEKPDAGAAAAPAAGIPAAPATAPANAAAPEANANPNQSLADQVDDFWHYGQVGRYDLQATIGKRLIAAGQQNPEDLLRTFEQIAQQHRQINGEATNVDTELLRWQAADPQMQQVATQLIELLNKGRFARRQNPQFIAENIRQLAQSERAYVLAMQQLRNSGELAVPQMVNILVSQRPEDVQYHDVIRRGLVDLGRAALNPLLASTQMSPREAALTTICGVLGDIGYPVSTPYLLALAHGQNSSSEVRDAANVALRRLNANANANAGDLFYDLADKYYYGTASIQPDPRSPRAFIWYWGDGGLTAKAVPPQIFNDIMSMRETEHALRTGAARADQAVALWLAGNIRRTVDLPQGETDPTRSEGEPTPHYYNVAEGAQYLNIVLDRSLKDNTPQSPSVALAAIKSLQDIVGQSNLFTGATGQPLVQAMRYSDRQVRYEAAFALASALPQRPFAGQDMVVPLLAEAGEQSGTPGVVIVASQGDRPRFAADLKNYATAGGADPASAIADAASLPAVDVILMPEDIGNPQIDTAIDLASQNPRMARAAKLIIVHSLASPWAKLAITDPTISYTEATGGEPLVNAIEQARKKAGGLAMDQAVATNFALRAANLLAKLATTRGHVLNVAPAEQTLITALGDKRAPIAIAVGQAVAMLNSPRAQSALADRANEAGAAPEVRISLYKSLATSAKFFGNRLDPGQTQALQGVVTSEKDLKVRDAAAEARGALNLPASGASALIVERRD